jgi:hypothetical protein
MMWLGDAYFASWKDIVIFVIFGLLELAWLGVFVWQIYNNFLAK